MERHIHRIGDAHVDPSVPRLRSLKLSQGLVDGRADSASDAYSSKLQWTMREPRAGDGFAVRIKVGRTTIEKRRISGAPKRPEDWHDVNDCAEWSQLSRSRSEWKLSAKLRSQQRNTIEDEAES